MWGPRAPNTIIGLLLPLTVVVTWVGVCQCVCQSTVQAGLRWTLTPVPHKIFTLFITSMTFGQFWCVGTLQIFFWSSCGGPISVGARVRPNMLNMPKSASASRNSKGFIPSEGVKWQWGKNNSQLPANKSQKQLKLLLMTNRKLHTPFWSVPITAKINDLGWPWMADMHSIAEKMRLSEDTTQIWMKIDPYCRRQVCSPMTLLPGDIRFMRIFAGIPWGGASNDSGVVDNGNFQRFCWLFLRETLEIRPALLHSDTQSVVGFSVLPKCRCVTLIHLEWLFRVTFCFRAGLAGSDRATFEK